MVAVEEAEMASLAPPPPQETTCERMVRRNHNPPVVAVEVAFLKVWEAVENYALLSYPPGANLYFPSCSLCFAGAVHLSHHHAKTEKDVHKSGKFLTQP